MAYFVLTIYLIVVITIFHTEHFTQTGEDLFDQEHQYIFLVCFLSFLLVLIILKLMFYWFRMKIWRNRSIDPVTKYTRIRFNILITLSLYELVLFTIALLMYKETSHNVRPRIKRILLSDETSGFKTFTYYMCVSVAIVYYIHALLFFVFYFFYFLFITGAYIYIKVSGGFFVEQGETVAISNANEEEDDQKVIVKKGEIKYFIND